MFCINTTVFAFSKCMGYCWIFFFKFKFFLEAHEGEIWCRCVMNIKTRNNLCIEPHRGKRVEDEITATDVCSTIRDNNKPQQKNF